MDDENSFLSFILISNTNDYFLGNIFELFIFREISIFLTA